MTQKETKLRQFGQAIMALIGQKDISRLEAKELYRQVILNEQPELQQGAFLVAHLMKGPTTEELCGAWDALYEYDTAKINPDFAWQSRFHDHIIRNDKSFHNISEYIINNPSKWQEDKFYKT